MGIHIEYIFATLADISYFIVTESDPPTQSVKDTNLPNIPRFIIERIGELMIKSATWQSTKL